MPEKITDLDVCVRGAWLLVYVCVIECVWECVSMCLLVWWTSHFFDWVNTSSENRSSLR